jgi:hypothetical protein
MSAIISINGTEAAITGGEWSCKESRLLQRLNDLYPSSALPDEVNAREAIEKLGGSIVSIATNPDDEEEEGEYLSIH